MIFLSVTANLSLDDRANASYSHTTDEPFDKESMDWLQNIKSSTESSMGSEKESEDSFDPRNVLRILVPIIFGLVVIVGLLGNFLVVFVIIVNRQMRSTTNYLIASLAVADLLFIVFCVPFTGTDYILLSWPFGEVWCKVVQYLTHVTAYASVFTLLLLSIDRYLAVVHPIAAMAIRTEKNGLCAIVCMWTVIVLSCVPLYVVHGLMVNEVNDPRTYHCTYLSGTYDEVNFRIGVISTMYILPVTVLALLYVKILHRLWQRSRPGGRSSAESVRSKKRVTKMVVIIVVTFLVCWFPIQVVLLLKSLDLYRMTNAGVMIQVAAQTLAYTNSCVNPILYAFLSKPFRQSFRAVINMRSNVRLLTSRSGEVQSTVRNSQASRNSTVCYGPERSSLILHVGRGSILCEKDPCNGAMKTTILTEEVYCGPEETIVVEDTS